MYDTIKMKAENFTLRNSTNDRTMKYDEIEKRTMKYDTIKMMAENKNFSIIKVIGVGSFGVRALDFMYERGIKGVDFFVCNTDRNDLNQSIVPEKIQLGSKTLGGYGTGGDPEKGKQAVIEDYDKISNIFDEQAKMAFIAAGMGGGTGTGAAPMIADIALKKGLLTIAVVSLPPLDEGEERLEVAIEGIKEMAKSADSVLIINNEKVFELYDENTPYYIAKESVYKVLNTAVKGIAELITIHGHINLDFADVRTVTKQSGVSVMGSATVEGKDRALKAIKQALVSPLLMSSNVRQAKQILLNVYFSSKKDEAIKLSELEDIANYVDDAVGEDANIILGVNYDDSLKNQVTVTIIATGFELEDVLDQKYFIQKVRPSSGDRKDTTQREGTPIYNGEKVWLTIGMKEEDRVYYSAEPAHKRSDLKKPRIRNIGEKVKEYKLETDH